MEEDGIKSIPLGQLMEMRKNGKEIRGMRGSDGSTLLLSFVLILVETKIKRKGKRDKHAPQEISSKKRVHKKKSVETHREIRGNKLWTKNNGQDPRFDSLSGKFNYDLFRKSYKFIESKQDEEIKEMREDMFKQEDENNKRSIQVTKYS